MEPTDLARVIVENGLSELEGAVRVLWRKQRVEGMPEVPPESLADFFVDHAISHPNRSRFKARLAGDRRVLRNPRTGAVRLKAAALAKLDGELGSATRPERPASGLIAALEKHAGLLQGVQTRSFVDEAIECARNGTPRAAIIMSWCGAVSVLQEYVFQHRLAAFNADAVANGLLKSPAKSLDDLRDISKESHFLESLARISLIDDATKRTLKRCLGRRNDVGHPSEVRVSDAAVADHIECLILNVFDRFAAKENPSGHP